MHLNSLYLLQQSLIKEQFEVNQTAHEYLISHELAPLQLPSYTQSSAACNEMQVRKGWNKQSDSESESSRVMTSHAEETARNSFENKNQISYAVFFLFVFSEIRCGSLNIWLVNIFKWYSTGKWLLLCRDHKKITQRSQETNFLLCANQKKILSWLMNIRKQLMLRSGEKKYMVS